MKTAINQLHYLAVELTQIVNRRWWRWLTIWFGSSAGVHVAYRLDRFFYLLLGKPWGGLRVLFYPLFLLLRLLSSPHQIHYTADIGKGLRILHPVLGIVVSGKTIAGENLVLTGGNCIGGREAMAHGDIVIGHNVRLGANAVVLGPARIGNSVIIGAGAVVVDSIPDSVVVAGVPAKIIKHLIDKPEEAHEHSDQR
jgi:serine acetyltransferase